MHLPGDLAKAAIGDPPKRDHHRRRAGPPESPCVPPRGQNRDADAYPSLVPCAAVVRTLHAKYIVPHWKRCISGRPVTTVPFVPFGLQGVQLVTVGVPFRVRITEQ